MTYLSTLAVLQLDAILTNAVLVETTPANPKKKNQKGFKSMLRMSYNCPGIGLVKMMVGVKQSDKTKVQYCITAIDTAKTIKQEADWPPVSIAPRQRGGITSRARIKLAGTSRYPLSIRITVYYLNAKVAIIIKNTKPSCTPKWNNCLLWKVIFLPYHQALDSVNMDYKGLESTFWVPRSYPSPPEKGSILYHLGLQEKDWRLPIPFLVLPCGAVIKSTCVFVDCA